LKCNESARATMHFPAKARRMRFLILGLHNHYD
jgi:hypothetical protein